MKKVNSDSKLTKVHLIIVFVGVFLGLSLFRAIRSHINSNDEMNRTLVEVDGKSYVPLKPDYENEIRELKRKGNQIQAIKRYREITGAGLFEAKNYVDQL